MTGALHWPPETLPSLCHGTAIALNGRGLLVVGPSGSGKSSLALQLIAHGAGLVSDDLTQLDRAGDDLILSYPDAAQGPARIEARGVGLLEVETHGPARAVAIVDLAKPSHARLPEPDTVQIGKLHIKCLPHVDNPAFPAMLLLFLRQATDI